MRTQKCFLLMNKGAIAKEALSPVLKALADGQTPKRHVKCPPNLSEDTLKAIIKRIVNRTN
jgi:Glu-tRNA(Gln) amidotransferase subunit E-like FAD-binding protein